MNPDLVRDKFRGALLGGAIGDALGAPFEGHWIVEPEAVERVTGQFSHPQYTDDTHMTIGVAQSLIACQGFDGAHMAGTLASNYAAEPWRGYGSGPPQVFRLLQQGVAWDDAARGLFHGTGSFGNGAAMRVAPVALFAHRNLYQVSELARQTAILTHTHELAIEGASLQACATAILILQKAEVPLDAAMFLCALCACTTSSDYLERLVRMEALLSEGRRDAATEFGNGVAAIEAVPAAICTFLQAPDVFADVVTLAIQQAGDTDTIASMAGTLCGAYLGESGIPALWREQVEGADLIRDLADELARITEGCGMRSANTR